MSREGDIASFRRKLEEAQANYKAQESLIRSDYAIDVSLGRDASGRPDEELLEHTTRLFLIDPMLDALGWSATDPTRVVQEARSRTRDAARDRLYFDYLGICQARTPVLAVEAKGLDSVAPRRPRGDEPNALGMATTVAAALDSLKAGQEPSGLLGQWVQWLSDQKAYVDSLGEPARLTLRRLVMTSGRWLIVFEDPKAAFLDAPKTDVRRIHCFTSFEDVLAGHRQIFELLHRDRLVDTLPLTMTLAEASRVLDPAAITGYFRGVVVATTISGPARRRYPTRTIHAAIVAQSGGRDFALVDYTRRGLEEPLSPEADAFSNFLDGLQRQATNFEHDVLKAFGLDALDPAPVTAFTTRAPAEKVEPLHGSTAAAQAAITHQKLWFVRETGEAQRGAGAREYLVVTGESWFYKLAIPTGASCDLHSWPRAKEMGHAEASVHMGELATSNTTSGTLQHCADTRVHGYRTNRCQVDMIESHLCCRACIFHAICWANPAEAARLPCPA